MRAKDVMTAPAVMVAPETTVEEIAQLLKRGISAVPVIGADARLAGIVSEGDLMRRVEWAPSARARGGCAYSATQMCRRANTPSCTAGAPPTS